MRPDSPLRLLVCFDTLCLAETTLSGAAVRELQLNAALQANHDVEVRFVLADVGCHPAAFDDWPFRTYVVSPALLAGSPEAVAAIVGPYRPDIVLTITAHEAVAYGRRLADSLGAALLYEAHDDEAAVLASLGAGSDELERMRRLQRVALAVSDLVVALTETDRLALAALGLPAPVEVVPMGVDVARRRSAEPDPAHPQLLFIGNLYYEPNAIAARELCRAVAPALDRLHAPFQIKAVGRVPAEVMAECQHERLTFTGPLVDLNEATHGAAAGLAPLTAGSGMKSKVLDYLAAGLPVIASAQALPGLPQALRDLVVLAPDGAGVAGAAMALWADLPRARRLGAEGRRQVERLLSWDAIASRALEAYRSCRRLPGRAPAELEPDLRAYLHRGPFWQLEVAAKRAWPYPPITSADTYVDVRPGLRRTLPAPRPAR